ncbi:MAG: UPF0175 family protein [Candidatus Sumerlaeota bacterium]
MPFHLVLNATAAFIFFMNSHGTKPIVLNVPDFVDEQEARWFLALKLFEMQKVPMGWAAEIAGVTKRYFIENAGRYGVAILNYDPGDLEREMNMEPGGRNPEQ